MILALIALAFMTDAPKPPTISEHLQKEFYKAQSQLVQSQAALDKAQADVDAKRKAFTEAIDAMQRACGDAFTLKGDAQGDPSLCEAKPKPPEKTEAPAKK